MAEEPVPAKIQYVPENVRKCICSSCPVQAESKCAKDLDKGLKETMKQNTLPEASQTPRLYCSIGISSCKDLDYDQSCLCPACTIYGKFHLEKASPDVYYCKLGGAKDGKS